MHTRKIIFWEPCSSPHTSGLYEAIAELAPWLEIIKVQHEGLPISRGTLGWREPVSHRVQKVVSPSAKEITRLVKDAHIKETLHVLSDFRNSPTVKIALKEIKKRDARFLIMAEPRSKYGLFGVLRRMQSKLGEGWLRRNCMGVLAIGAHGPDWFRSVGYPTQKVFQFAYFVDVRAPKTSSTAMVLQRNFTFGFLGRIEKSKGAHDFLWAAERCGLQSNFLVCGAGSLVPKCIEGQKKSRGGSIKFGGVLPMEEVSSFMSDIDMLVVPSHVSDGWGVVVSEALLNGVPVIASNRVGASIAIQDNFFGEIVAYGLGFRRRLLSAMLRAQALGRQPHHQKQKMMVWAHFNLSTGAGAKYFLDIVKAIEIGAAPPDWPSSIQSYSLESTNV